MRTLRIAIEALRRNTLRTVLTTLSIGIGIAAVMCVVAIGSGSMIQVEQQIDNLGDNFVWIEPGSRNVAGVRTGWGGSRSLRAEDARAIEELVPQVDECSAVTDGREQIIAAGTNWRTRYEGVDTTYFTIRRWQMRAGLPFSTYDVEQAARVVVLGQVVAEQVFPDEDPVGRTVRIGRFPFTIVGVLQSKGVGAGGVDRDDVIYLPYTTAERSLHGEDWLDDIMCSVEPPEDTDLAEAQIMQVLRLQHGIEPGGDDDFGIRKPLDILATRAEAMSTMTMMLMGIASVSLLVGGVGIMNIMLVSVTERTHEIGLRLAVGARMADIRVQFLVEAALLGAVGGTVGVLVGWVGSEVISAMYGWPVRVEADAAWLAVTCAVAAGLVFGYYPAHQASGLDPIEAMRAEV